MVYVFGIDLPIMEMLAIYGTLIFIGIIIVWYEVFKLRKLIMIERDLDKEMNLSNLEKYIKKMMDFGTGEDDIKKSLLSRGWDDKLLSDAIAKVKEAFGKK